MADKLETEARGAPADSAAVREDASGTEFFLEQDTPRPTIDEDEDHLHQINIDNPAEYTNQNVHLGTGSDPELSLVPAPDDAGAPLPDSGQPPTIAPDGHPGIGLVDDESSRASEDTFNGAAAPASAFGGATDSGVPSAEYAANVASDRATNPIDPATGFDQGNLGLSGIATDQPSALADLGATAPSDAGSPAEGLAGLVEDFLAQPEPAPVVEPAVIDAPVADAPVVDAPVADAPVVDAPVVDTPPDPVSIKGSPTEDLLYGTRGDSVIESGKAHDRLVGGEGNDTMNGGSDEDVFIGGAGNDVADGGAGQDFYIFSEGDGADIFHGGADTDMVLLRDGDGSPPAAGTWDLNLTSGTATWEADRVLLSNGAEGSLTLADGSTLQIDGVEEISWADEETYGKDGIQFGTDGADNITGANHDQTILGGAGDDVITGGNQLDLLIGGAGDDDLFGGQQRDMLMGGEGNDTLDGGRQDDQLIGGAGDDLLIGGKGSDTMWGDEGDDVLQGDVGDDLFIFAAGDGHDIVSGGIGNRDTIELDGVDGGPGDGPWSIDFDAGAITETGDDYLVLSDAATGTISFDDGSEIAFTGIERIEW